MSLLGFAAAGLAEGLGEGLVQRANAAREERLQALRHAQQEALQERHLGFQAEQGRTERDWRTGERIAGQEFTAAENVRARAAARAGGSSTPGDRIVREDGTVGYYKDGKWTAITDEAGEPVKQSVTQSNNGISAGGWLVQYRAERSRLDDEDGWYDKSASEKDAEALARTEALLGPNPSGRGAPPAGAASATQAGAGAEANPIHVPDVATARAMIQRGELKSGQFVRMPNGQVAPVR